MSIAMFRSVTRPGRNNLIAVGVAAMLLAACGSARAQGPIPGQAYQIPAAYQGYAPGTVVTFSGYNYVIQANGTMMPGEQSSYTSYYVPPAPRTIYVTPGYGSYYYGSGLYRNRPWYGPGPWYGPRPGPWYGPRRFR